jgi:hypothetical protein
MKKIRIYDIDKHVFGSDTFTDVLRLQILTSNLRDQGVDAQIVNRASQPEAFMAEEDVVRLFEAEGAAAFPCMTVDGLISWAGSYPANEQVLCEAEVQLDFCGSGDDNPCASCGRCSGRS